MEGVEKGKKSDFEHGSREGRKNAASPPAVQSGKAPPPCHLVGSTHNSHTLAHNLHSNRFLPLEFQVANKLTLQPVWACCINPHLTLPTCHIFKRYSPLTLQSPSLPPTLLWSSPHLSVTTDSCLQSALHQRPLFSSALLSSDWPATRPRCWLHE